MYLVLMFPHDWLNWGTFQCGDLLLVAGYVLQRGEAEQPLTGEPLRVLSVSTQGLVLVADHGHNEGGRETTHR